MSGRLARIYGARHQQHSDEQQGSRVGCPAETMPTVWPHRHRFRSLSLSRGTGGSGPTMKSSRAPAAIEEHLFIFEEDEFRYCTSFATPFSFVLLIVQVGSSRRRSKRNIICVYSKKQMYIHSVRSNIIGDNCISIQYLKTAPTKKWALENRRTSQGVFNFSK